ncbi:MAG: hypothetical protein JXA22_04415 [Candidatus Thermoplasmatota archaeon]|nr:hypothetical protein [Candidatus Thermoplasmatota archaeon]
MKTDRKEITVIILSMDSEMVIGSVVAYLKFYLEEKVGTLPRITVIDNGSKDRTRKVALMAGVNVVNGKERVMWSDVVMKALDLGKKSNSHTIVILDLTGGNDVEDAVSLISKSIEEGERFASGYIRPLKGQGSIGCWAIDKDLIGMVGGEKKLDVENKLTELASKQDLEVLSIRERIPLSSKRKRQNLFSIFKRSPLKTMSIIMKYHPLTFYGSVGMLILMVAIAAGFYTVEYFYDHGELSYFPAFTTVALVMIGGFFMVAGLMLNSLNVLVDQLEAMKKWVK